MVTIMKSPREREREGERREKRRREEEREEKQKNRNNKEVGLPIKYQPCPTWFDSPFGKPSNEKRF